MKEYNGATLKKQFMKPPIATKRIKKFVSIIKVRNARSPANNASHGRLDRGRGTAKLIAGMVANDARIRLIQ